MVQELVERMRAGDQRSLARLLTLVERSPDDAVGVLEAVHAHTGHATIVGITGPPGAGKSTLVDKLTSAYRTRGSGVQIPLGGPRLAPQLQ